MSELYVGIDVSQDRLDIATSDGREFHLGNDEAGHRQLCELLAPEQPQLIVMEATGGLERAAAAELAAAGLALRIVNARQVRDFAKASGRLAKTDRLDARVLVSFARAMKLEPREVASEQQQAMDFQHRRLDYIAAFLAHLVDWKFAHHNLSVALSARASVPVQPKSAGPI